MRLHVRLKCGLSVQSSCLHGTWTGWPATATPQVMIHSPFSHKPSVFRLQEICNPSLLLRSVKQGTLMLAVRAALQVGVGCAAAKEVIDAVAKAVLDAKKHFVSVPLTRSFSFPHRIDGIAGAAKVMLRPASEGTGVIAGGSVRIVLELAGIKNAFGKQLGSGNPLNNARATVDGLRRQRTMQMVAAERGLTMEELIGYQRAGPAQKDRV